MFELLNGTVLVTHSLTHSLTHFQCESMATVDYSGHVRDPRLLQGEGERVGVGMGMGVGVGEWASEGVAQGGGLRCSLCLLLLRRPEQCRRGHLFCGGCMDALLGRGTSGDSVVVKVERVSEWESESESGSVSKRVSKRVSERVAECPICRIKLKANEVSVNVLASNMVERLVIRCPTTLTLTPTPTLTHSTGQVEECEIGVSERSKKKIKVEKMSPILSTSTTSTHTHTHTQCDWVGTIGSVNVHLQSCTHAQVVCPHLGCEATPMRNKLSEHLKVCSRRLIACDYCKCSIVYCELNNHKENCRQKSNTSTRLRQRKRSLADSVHGGTITPSDSLVTPHRCQTIERDKYEAIVQKKDILIAKLRKENESLRQLATISQAYMNKYPLLVDRCHCCDIDAWNELNALAKAGDKVALAYSILVLATSSVGGSVIQQDMNEACRRARELKQWLQCEHKCHNVHATYVLGFLYFRGINFYTNTSTGMELFGIAAEKGHIGAMNWVAFGYLSKKRAKKDKLTAVERSEKAIHFLQECTARGLLEAKFDLANLLMDGSEGCSKDERQAFDFYKDLADQNYLPALVNLGHCYEKGAGERVPNMKLAFQCYKKAADLGDPQAQRNLGVMYYRGFGVSANDELGKSYIEKAVAQGLIEAKYLLLEPNTS